MSEKTFKIVGNDLSDGYHTFDELYEHRHMLFIALARSLTKKSRAQRYWIPDHYEGWDLLVIEDFSKQTQYQPYLHPQISYHLPIRLRVHYEHFPQKTKEEYSFDGHTARDVLIRLATLGD